VFHGWRLTDAVSNFNGKAAFTSIGGRSFLTPHPVFCRVLSPFFGASTTMKKSITAPLCSGLVIPGLGQVLNGQLRKGLILMGSVFVLFVAGAVKLGFILTSLGRPADPSGTSQAAAVGQGDVLFLGALAAVFAILWVCAVADAFWVAFQSERAKGGMAQ
jgi:TM2 domain-containing membrane protein YozV